MLDFIHLNSKIKSFGPTRVRIAQQAKTEGAGQLYVNTSQQQSTTVLIRHVLKV